MRSLLIELKNKDILEEFGGRRADGEPDSTPWTQLMDADLVRCFLLNSEERVLNPKP